MTDYSRGQNFTAMAGGDSLPSVFDTEFNSVATHSVTKADKLNPTFSGTVVIPALSASVSHTGNGTKTSPARSNEIYMHAFPTGTKMAFFQAGAPIGWTQDTSNNDALLRVVSGAGSGTGGTGGIAAGSSTVTGSTAISIAQMPPHTHNSDWQTIGGANGGYAFSTTGNNSTISHATSSIGSGTGHTHALTSWKPKYIDMIIATKD